MFQPTEPVPNVKTDETFQPGELDADPEYRAWCQEYESGRWEARLAEEAALEPARDEPAPTFVEMLYSEANRYLDMDEPDLCWLGGQIARLADRARFLDATSGASFDDREDAARDRADA